MKVPQWSEQWSFVSLLFYGGHRWVAHPQTGMLLALDCWPMATWCDLGPPSFRFYQLILATQLQGPKDHNFFPGHLKLAATDPDGPPTFKTWQYPMKQGNMDANIPHTIQLKPDILPRQGRTSHPLSLNNREQKTNVISEHSVVMCCCQYKWTACTQWVIFWRQPALVHEAAQLLMWWFEKARPLGLCKILKFSR